MLEDLEAGHSPRKLRDTKNKTHSSKDSAPKDPGSEKNPSKPPKEPEPDLLGLDIDLSPPKTTLAGPAPAFQVVLQPLSQPSTTAPPPAPFQPPSNPLDLLDIEATNQKLIQPAKPPEAPKRASKGDFFDQLSARQDLF